MNILALSDSLAPWHSFWIRFGQYVPAMENSVQISSDVSRINHLGNGDALLLYRYDRAWGDLSQPICAAKARGVRIYSDVDDYLWEAQGWERERLLGYTRALNLCERISCSTPALVSQLQVMFRQAEFHWLPNTAPHVGPPDSPERNDQPLRIGWTGAPWTRPDDLAILRPLAHWVVAHPTQMQLVHLGHAEGRLSFAEAIGVHPSCVQAIPLQSHGDYLRKLRFDIGLAPLTNTSFNTYKSPIKVLEYSALGIPWLASDALPYRDLCQRWGWQGRLCTTASDWIQQLQPLLDGAKRRCEAQKLQALCKTHASFQQGVIQWERLFKQTIANG